MGRTVYPDLPAERARGNMFAVLTSAGYVSVRESNGFVVVTVPGGDGALLEAIAQALRAAKVQP
jgi:hypothetical protein